jgi:hypothetical protein
VCCSQAIPTRSPTVGFTHAGANLTHDPDGLVAGNEWKRGVGQLAFDDVKVRPADPADSEANQDLPRVWLRYWKLTQL